MKRLSFGVSGGVAARLVIIGAFVLTIPSAGHAYSLNLDVYTVGSNPAGHALDPLGNNIGGIPSISWTFTVPSLGQAQLAILAEGVDGGPNAPGGGEHDQVFFNGVLLGNLTQQDFYSPLYNLRPGPGALPDITAETMSFFDVFPVLGINTVKVDVDPNNWVNEIETSSLVGPIPEPATLLLVAGGLGALVAFRRKLRK